MREAGGLTMETTVLMRKREWSLVILRAADGQC